MNSPIETLQSNERQTFDLAVDYVKLLSLLGVERANSGHPGLPLGCASLGVLLYRYILRFNANIPNWNARDKFVLSAGHGSMLLYALNYLFGHATTLEDLAQFRSLHSKTPGHPELDVAYGIETTTGPLGQGFANAVGMAMDHKLFSTHAEAILEKKSTASTISLKDLYAPARVFVLMGDGCMMEGITQEAASLAGCLGLNNLIAIYDDNNASIDGHVSLTMREDTAKRFRALNWHVETVTSDDPLEQLSMLLNLMNHTERPKLLVMKTKIGAGLKKWEGDPGIHGRPAGKEAIAEFLLNSPLAKHLLSGESEPTLACALEYVEKVLETKNFPAREAILPSDFYENIHGKKAYDTWNQVVQTYQEQNSSAYQVLEASFSQTLPNQTLKVLREQLFAFQVEKPDASRGLAGKVLNLIAENLPNLVGGSADLVASTKATIKNSSYISETDFTGRNIAFGVREHGMGAIGNGIALGKHYIPFTSTFLVFSDYMRPSIRLAALMKLKHLFIFSHDSFYVGEDGPTHQPIEQVSSLRLIPDLQVFRPATAREMAFAFLYFLEHSEPVVIITSRQNLQAELFTLPEVQNQEMTAIQKSYQAFQQGAYILAPETKPETLDLVLVGSGSEVGNLLVIKQILEAKGYSIRLVSAPALTQLEQADSNVWQKLFASHHSKQPVPCYFCEATSTRGWSPFLGEKWTFKTLNQFGASAPYSTLETYLQFDKDTLLKEIESLLTIPKT